MPAIEFELFAFLELLFVMLEYQACVARIEASSRALVWSRTS